MKNVTIFLSGSYRKSDLDYYRKLCRGRFTVAANGGHRFFVKTNTRPDLVIGDMDSISAAALRRLDGCSFVQVPAEKDQTDSELAVTYCLANGARSVDIVDPGCGNLDHLLGNLLLSELVKRISDLPRASAVS